MALLTTSSGAAPTLSAQEAAIEGGKRVIQIPITFRVPNELEDFTPPTPETVHPLQAINRRGVWPQQCRAERGAEAVKNRKGVVAGPRTEQVSR